MSTNKQHDLIFFEKRSTPKVVGRGDSFSAPDSYGKVTKRRRATEDEEKVIARGDWLRVDESGKKGGEDGYKKTRMAGREHLVHGVDGELDVTEAALLSLGVNPDDLGFVGLEMHLPPDYKLALEPEWAYVSPVLRYAKGYDVNPHITLIYGLLFLAHQHKNWVNTALNKWHKPNVVLMTEVEAFDGDDGNELYSAIVLTLGENTWDLGPLKEANDELRKLPHVNGFPIYKPHITVGYVKREFKEQALAALRELPPRPITTGELDYGTPGD